MLFDNSRLRNKYIYTSALPNLMRNSPFEFLTLKHKGYKNINCHTNVSFMNVQGILYLFLALNICSTWCSLYER